ncbi:MAG: RluA family pseudouridine synthase [Oscillospiraceae bacterium]|nr:RluA family pseudouridine synthase [Candidatus Ruminococcus equi]
MENIKIIYEDEYIICALKKPNILSQGNENTKSLADEIGEYFSNKGENSYVGTVHRLDKLTSGIVMYSKDEKTTVLLCEMFQKGEIDKTYFAIVEGKPETDKGEFCDLLYYDRTKNKSFVVKRERKGVKKALLSFETLSQSTIENKSVSLVKISLMTGRTHQIRVQFSSRKMPIVGDRRYGSKFNTDGIMLYCGKLSFVHPVTHKKIEIESIPTNGYFEIFGGIL